MRALPGSNLLPKNRQKSVIGPLFIENNNLDYKTENVTNCLLGLLQYAGGIRKRSFHSENASNVFRPRLRWGKFNDYRDAIVSEKLRFQNVFRPHENEKPTFSNSKFEGRFRKAPVS